MKIIIVTGSVGSGKTYYSKRLAKKLGHDYVNLNDLIKKLKFYSYHDKKNKCYVVDSKRSEILLASSISNIRGFHQLGNEKCEIN